jgi:hypothetical protein
MTTRTCAALLAALSICGCAATNSPKTADVPGGSSPCFTSSTGSAIPAAPGTNCAPTQRSYSQADIYRTGRTTVAGALGQLDPGVVITH